MAQRRDKTSTFGELKLSQQGDFSWLFGLNYLKEKKRQSLGAQDLTTGQTEPTFEPPQFKQATDIAAFAAVSYQTDADWRFELGGRYERSKQQLKQDAITLFVPGVGALQSEAQDLEKTFTQFLPRVALSKQLDDDSTLYASAAQGWLPGGFNLAAAQQVAFEDFSE